VTTLKLNPKVGVISSSRLLREYLRELIGNHVVLSSIPSKEGLASDLEILLLDAQCARPAFVSQLLSQLPKTKVILMNADREDLDVVHCVRLGISAFILSEASPEMFLQTISAVSKGEKMIPLRIVEELCDQLYYGRRHSDGMEKIYSDLTVKERQILPLILDGLTNKEIGNALGIAECTVKNHVQHILRKCECSSRVELIRAKLDKE
jgi:DNA-binding NarL/FixJ family response regulator